MVCNKCNNEIGATDKFCGNCGNKIEQVVPEVEVQEQQSVEQVVSEPEVQEQQSVEQIVPEVEVQEQQSVEQVVPEAEVQDQQPVEQVVPETPAQSQNNKTKKKSNVGLIIGISVGVVAAIITMVITVTLINRFTNQVRNGLKDSVEDLTSYSNTFYGDGFSLNYDSDWSKVSVKSTDGQNKDALVYDEEEAYIVPIGISALSETENEYNLDFSTTLGKQTLYDKFYEYWNNGSTKLYGGSNGFSELKDNIYYATMNYGISSDNLNGKMYLIVSEDNNAILSFMSNVSEDFEENSDEILNLLKTIDISKTFDDEMAEILNSMSAWNQYSNVRQGELGIKKDINGSWRRLSDSEDYWVFKNGEYWWYKSYNDLNDNYWYGKTKILKGKEGLKEVGLDESKIDQITANAEGKVTADNIYTILFTPSKIISNGADVSSTNITGEDWKMVWIIVDHGKEGLEAQVLNVNTYDTSYYVKTKD